MGSQFDSIRAVVWHGDRLQLLDQRHLPGRVEYVECHDVEAVAVAIRDMVVRGAPAIGIAAAYGVALAARQAGGDNPQAVLSAAMAQLEGARPTAVNLHWAIARMRRYLSQVAPADLAAEAAAEAVRIHEEDVAANRRLGDLGAALIEPGGHVITHCNTGALATGGYGTALGIIRSAYAQGRIEGVFAGETRPWLQGARLTAWELHHEGIPVRLIADGAAAALMRGGDIRWVVVGADRIAANGDVANKIGTYALAIAARAHGVGFMVAAPMSTVDRETASGDDIPIETRAESELLSFADVPVAQSGVGAWNPVFDITPASLIDAIVTEAGVVHRPDAERMRALPGAHRSAQ